MQSKKGYIKGMVQDNTSSKFPEESYFKITNFRVVTEEGSSLGSLENEKGHILGFEVPNIPETTYGTGEDTFTIPAQNNLRIVGWTAVNDLIIIATTNETSANPTTSVSQIWAFSFNESNGEIIDSLPNNVLNIEEHLVYNRRLNLSTEYRVKMVGRYENAETIRIYFTDNYNFLRTINVKDPNIQLVEPNLLDLVADIDFIQPVIESVGSGNLPEGVQIQASYRLISDVGAVSLYAPPTPLLPLLGTPYDAPLTEFSGEGNQNNLTKSATFSFTNLDTRYDVIEFVIIVYNDFNVATVYKIDESAIPDTGNIIKTYSDINTAIVIPTELYNMLSSGFQIAKDIEVKDNLLLAANTKSQSSILDFDARCYRWSASGYSKITDVSNNVDLFIDTSNNIFENIADPAIGNWEEIPENHDCINPYNKEDSVDYADWKSNQQYKFQKDLTTLGGEGPNISYKFITETCVASTKMPDYPTAASLFRDGNTPHLNVGTSPGVTLNTGIEIDSLGTLQQYNTTGQYFNFASHTYNCYFAGHTRGETYRYGVCFYDKKGSVKFVNWIGDIRIPDPSDGFDLMTKTNTHGIDSDFPWLRTLGIEFTLDVSEIASEISGFSFVRVLRDESNRTRLGSGMLMWFETRFDNNIGPVILDYGTVDTYECDLWTSFRKSRGLSIDRATTSELKVFGASQRRHTIVRESVGWGSASDSWGTPNKRCTTYLVSPLGREMPVNYKDRDYIKTSGYYISRCHNFGLEAGSNQNDSKVGFIYMLSLTDEPSQSPQSYSHGEELIYIRHAQSLADGELLKAGTLNSLMGDYGLNDTIVNAGLGVSFGIGSNFNTYTPFGIGAKKLFMLLDKETPTDSGFINPVTEMDLYNPVTGDTFATSPENVHRLPKWDPSQGEANHFFSTEVSPFKEVQYCRFISNQYGGNTFSARSQNQYYFIGHFQPFIEGKTNYTNKVFYGDTFVNYYDQELTVSYTDLDLVEPDLFEDPDIEKNLLTTTVMCPVESPINTEFRREQQFSKRRQPDHIKFPEYPFSLTSYPLVHLNHDSMTNKYFAADFIQSGSDEHPNRVWYSEIKVNGEFQDSWRTFLPANYREVDGVLGEINKLINWRGSVYFYQNRGLGKLLINERSLIQDSTGSELSLGTGSGISDHSYISNDTGSIHQYGATKSINALYHYDARLKKVYRFNGESLEAISDTKGMSAFFDNEILGKIVNTDKTLSELDEGPIGVEAVFDYRYNRVIFTFLGTKPAKLYVTEGSYFTGEFIYNGGVIYEVLQSFSPTEATIRDLLASGIIKILDTKNQGFTITFNELLNAWEGYYDFIPGIYLQYGRRLISRSPFEPNKGFIHNQGEYGRYYNQGPFKSRLLTTLGVHGDFNKIFNNIEYYSQVSQNGVDIPLETFDEVRVYNDYQDTGLQENIANSLIKRRMRTWRHTIQRDSLSLNNRARIRNTWAHLELNYQNNNNKKHIVHDITYSFTPSRD